VAEGKTLFEILKDVTLDEDAPGKIPERPYDIKCAALIANYKNRGIVVSAKPNCALYWEISEIGTVDLGDYGLDLAPDGISIWEGVSVWRPGGYECPQDGQMEFEGEFRRPSAEELAKLAAGEPLWPEPPEEQDVDEDQRAEV